MGIENSDIRKDAYSKTGIEKDLTVKIRYGTILMNTTCNH